MAAQGYTGFQLSLIGVKEKDYVILFGPKPNYLIAEPKSLSIILEELWDQASEDSREWMHWGELWLEREE